MSPPSHPKIDAFDVLQANYKRIGDHQIRVDVLIPKTSYAAPRPIIVRFHGGGLVMGDSLFMDWWPQWISDLALENEAVIISPNYRLLPEATGAEIFADVEDFWTWMFSPELAKLLAGHSNPTALDTSRILTSGDSAGGLLSISLALAHPSEIRATTAAYPGVDFSSKAFAQPRTNDSLPFGQVIPKSVIDNFLTAAAGVTPVSSRTSHDSLVFMLAAAQHGTIPTMYERNIADTPREVMYPLLRLEQPGVRIPPGGITVIHGRQDSIVPVLESEKFIARVKEVTKGLPGNEGVRLTIRDGEHGFDIGVRVHEPWLKDALQFAVQTWLE